MRRRLKNTFNMVLLPRPVSPVPSDEICNGSSGTVGICVDREVTTRDGTHANRWSYLHHLLNVAPRHDPILTPGDIENGMWAGPQLLSCIDLDNGSNTLCHNTGTHKLPCLRLISSKLIGRTFGKPDRNTTTGANHPDYRCNRCKLQPPIDWTRSAQERRGQNHPLHFFWFGDREHQGEWSGKRRSQHVEAGNLRNRFAHKRKQV